MPPVSFCNRAFNEHALELFDPWQHRGKPRTTK
jgi:hypothetical protein